MEISSSTAPLVENETKGENTNQTDLLTLAELEAIDDEEWEAKD